MNSTGNGAAVPSRLPLDGDISNNSNRNKDRILSPPSINRMSLGSSHVVASTTITNLDSASQKFKLVSTFIARKLLFTGLLGGISFRKAGGQKK